MLEIRNITKVYRSKTGESVRALDNVSIAFPESGMVFILGKSGSGKSTLLNVIGGLDSYDSGEFIIMGKSSKNFGGSDFDAYRNTFVGFIFQEYNVLDDFTVGANIGLALELQGKKATDEKINAILSDVDLLNYAKRKPNELSGGQKQRVAIARALVKEPQIIMADEPTGALDSNTGKQIFDTLKSLSKKKLVLVVSHDRDFAEKYADRIIELSDGHIISDVTKHERKSERLSEGVHKINNSILRIEKGYKLTASDLNMINEYLAMNNSDVILSSDGRVNEELRSVAGITENGGTSVFEGTDKEKDYTLKEYDGKKTKFIHSRLPMKNAVRIGSSGLKHKKFRLVLTILLSTIAFALFGFADTMAAYEKISAATSSIIDSEISNASVNVNVRRDIYIDGKWDHYYYNTAKMNDADLDFLRETTGLNFVPVYTGSSYMDDGGFSIANNYALFSNSSLVYTGKLSGVVNLDDTALRDANLRMLQGKLPATEEEIVISELLVRSFNEYGFTNKDMDEKIEAGQVTAENILGKHISISSSWSGMATTYKIVGVVDTNFDYDRYESFMPSDTPGNDDMDMMDMVLSMELEDELHYGFHALGFLNADGIDALRSKFSWTNQQVGEYMSGWNTETYIAFTPPTYSEGEEDKPEENESRITLNSIANSSAISKLDITWINGEKTELADGEALVSSYFLHYVLPQNVAVQIDTEKLEVYAKQLYGKNAYDEANDSSNCLQKFIEVANNYYRAQAIEDFIDEKLNDSNILSKVSEFAKNNYGEHAVSKAQVKSFWMRYWLELNIDDPPVSNWEDYSLIGYKYEISGKYTNKAHLDLASFIVTEIYGFDAKALPALPDNNIGDLAAQSIVNNILWNISEEDNSVQLQSHQFVSALRIMYNASDYCEQELWLKDNIIDKAIEYGYFKESDWTEWDEDTRISILFNFYNDSYSYNSDNAYSSKSNNELSDMGQKALLDIMDLSLEDLLSDIEFERVERDWELNTETTIQTYKVKIVGLFSDNMGINNSLVVSDEIYDDYKEWFSAKEEENGGIKYEEVVAEHEDGIWAFAIAPMGSDKDVIQKLVELSYDNTSDLNFSLKNSVMNTLGSFNDFIEIFAVVFLYIGIGFAVFSALLLMNFIGTSISYKKREIGILRAVGARSSDVFKIFFSEALIIALINFIMSLTAVGILTNLVNNIMRNEGINITLLTFGIRQVILMFVISICVALVASFLPVYKIAKRKPIDAIRDR